MKYKDKNFKISYSSFALLMLIFHMFMSSLVQYYQANIIMRLVYWGVVIVLMILSKGTNYTKIHINKITVLLILMLVVMLYRNQNIKNGSITSELLFITLVIFLIFMQYSNAWYIKCIPYIEVFVKIHVVCTLWLSIDKWSYFNIIYPIVSTKYSALNLLTQYNNGWMPGITANYSVNAVYLSYAIAMFFIITLTERNKVKRNKNVVWLILSLFSLLLTGKRAPIIFSVLSIVIMYYFYMSDRKRGRVLKIVFILGLVITVVVCISMFIPQVLIFVDRFVEQIGKGDITTGRAYLQELALNMFNENKLLGIGWDGFKYEYLNNISIDGVILNVHNVYIQLLTECGIIGALPFYIFFLVNINDAIQILVSVVKQKKDSISINVLRNSMLAVFVELFFLMYCVTGNPMYDEQTIIMYILSCAIVKKTKSYLKFIVQSAKESKKYK